MDQKPLGKRKRTRVLVVGSGLAGLTTAYLLTAARAELGFEVVVFEMGDSPALDAASIAYPSSSSSSSPSSAPTRIDIPMRSFTIPYYPRLSALLAHLRLSTTPQNFTFTFPGRLRFPSNLHRLPSRPPPSSTKDRPASFVGFVLELAFLAAVYLYFTLLILLPISQPKENDTLDAYTQRWRIPRRFVTEYLAPLMGAVTSADADRVGALPAVDVVEYRRRTLGAGHVVVEGGVGRVQDKLVAAVNASGRGRILFGKKVIRVEDEGEGVRVSWTTITTANAGGEMEQQQQQQEEEYFDKIVFATSPDVVAACYPRASMLKQIPVWPVEVVVERSQRNAQLNKRHQERKINEIVLAPNGAATHWIDDQISVTTRPCSWATRAKTPAVSSSSSSSSTAVVEHVATRSFTRVGKSVEARQVIMKHAMLHAPQRRRDATEEKAEWRCGDNGVFVVGGWCWDGMVLLEGCVQSAERVARGLVAERETAERLGR